MRFSEREGITPVNTTMQVTSINMPLRNRLWNLIVSLFESWYRDIQVNYSLTNTQAAYLICRAIWSDYLKLQIDEMPIGLTDYIQVLKRYFMGWQWYDVYNFLEYFYARLPTTYRESRKAFAITVNRILQEEMSAYRLVGDCITKLTSQEEIEAVEAALRNTGKLAPVSRQINDALHLLSDKQNPSYKDSIKNSIAAVETVCNLIASKSHASLGDALALISTKQPVLVHAALIEGFKKLYGWTSNAQGIRHALMDEPDLDFDDAKYMLVSCSAFTNYLVAKANKAGIQI
jgi:AbiJ N-terminal domain 4